MFFVKVYLFVGLVCACVIHFGKGSDSKKDLKSVVMTTLIAPYFVFKRLFKFVVSKLKNKNKNKNK